MTLFDINYLDNISYVQNHTVIVQTLLYMCEYAKEVVLWYMNHGVYL